MKWQKHGVVWRPDGSLPWARSHATCPTPLRRADGSLRVYLQSRDAHNVGRIGFVDLDPEDPRRVIRASRQPVFDIGAPGSFDDNGVFPTSVIMLPDGRLFMYYVGFELCHHIRYRLLTGLAISEDGGDTFVRAKATPILERSPAEMHFRCGPCVLHDGDRFRMWYVAGSEWATIDGKPMPVYDLRYLESSDGIHWPERGRVVLPVQAEHEHGFGRPWVVRDGDGYRMHYSVRRRSPARYRLGLAHSRDGLAWQRCDERIGLDVSPGEWDGDSIEYGTEIEAGGRTWLLYNGDDFGATGFGVAELLEP
jgi:predicted GH43/DUF377 family glycosyl hydrolase